MPTPSSRSAAETHQTGQALIASSLSAAVAAHAWPQFDPLRINDSMPGFVATIMALLHRYGLASSVHAATFYQQQRAAAGVPGRFKPGVAPQPSVEQVEKELRWAVSGLYDAAKPVSGVGAGASGSTGFVAGTGRPVASKKPPTVEPGAKVAPATPVEPSAPGPSPFTVDQDAIDLALVKVQGVTQTLALDQSRDTVLTAVQDDDKAKGWARVPEASACSFCLLLATRGAVYKSGHSFDRSNAKFTGDGKFKVHDHCACHIEPLFADHYEPTAQVRAAQALYAKTPYGSSPAEARNNFRVALQKERDAGRFAG